MGKKVIMKTMITASQPGQPNGIKLLEILEMHQKR